MCAESSNEMTEIVKSNCVAHVSDRHTGFQEFETRFKHLCDSGEKYS